MTHVYAYIKGGYSGEQLKELVAGIKGAVTEGFLLDPLASTVAVKELKEDCYSDNFGALVLVYTAAGKGLDVKKRFARLLYQALEKLPGARDHVQMVIKEQASDMTGVNGVLRCNKQDVNTAWEIG